MDSNQETEEEIRRSLLLMRRQLVGEHPEENELDSCYKNIPVDLIPEVFSRLPIKSIGRFLLASKSCRVLITSRRFSFMHAKNKPFYTLFGTLSSNFYRGCAVEVSENGDSVKTDLTHYSDNLSSGSRVLVLLVGSCYGLLCLVQRRYGFDNIFIFNPVTKEKTRINSSNYDLKRCAVHYRFGYNPSTNEYKVFRCFTAVPNVGGFRNEYDILTVGVDKRWRKLSPELFPNYIRLGNRTMVPSCKGTFHWLAGDSDDDINFILAFDIAEENTRRIPIPQTDQRYLRSLVSNDPLCLYYREDQANVIWKMEDDGDRWSQIEVPNMPHERSVDFIMSLDSATKCGGILFRVVGCDALGLYCPKSKKYTAIPFPRDPKLFETRLWCELTPSFCSINEIMSKLKRLIMRS